MGQVLLTHNTIEPARDPFTVSLSESVRDQIQPVCKRRKVAQTSEDCEHSTTTNLEKNYLYDDVGYSISQDAMQPVLTSDEIHIISMIETFLWSHCSDDDDDDKQTFTVTETPLQTLPDLALGQTLPLCRSNDTIASLPVISIPSPDFLTSPYKTDQERWKAVLERDGEACGKFVYCVRTTGIFCRPTCPSRRPSMCNVLFCSTNEEAEKAGFRPCKRCKPQDLVLPSDFRQMVAVESVKEEIEVAAMLGTKLPSLRYLSGKVGMSSFHFHRVFKARTGMTLQEFRKLVLAQKRS